MTDSQRHQALLLAEFHDRYWSDYHDGKVRSLEEYQEQFPLIADLIAVELEALAQSEESTRSDAAHEVCDNEQRIAHYRLIEVIGRGGQATVWLAEDERLGRSVALKILRGDPSHFSRFEREAALTARIDHPAICPMLDLGTDGQPWIAMRYVPGTPLSEILRRDRTESGDDGPHAIALPGVELDDPNLTPTGSSASRSHSQNSRHRHHAILRMVETVARAIHSAHELGIVHRDLKPSNIMIQPDGEPVVLDFGVALDQHSDLPGLTLTGDMVGTPAYMAPEQIQSDGHGVDRRADVHALGVVLFECLTTRRPFNSPHRDALYRTILNDEAPRVRTLCPALPHDVDIILQTALQKNPEHRYVDALSFAEDIRRVLENRPIQARPAGPLTRLARWAQRNTALALACGAILITLISGLIATTTLWRSSSNSLIRESEARRQKEQAFDALLRQRQGIFRLRAIKSLQDLKKEARDELWPLAPHDLNDLDRLRAKLDSWLTRAAGLGAGLDSSDPDTDAPSHRRQLEILRAQARQPTTEEKERDQKGHPLFAGSERLKAELAAESRALGVAQGKTDPERPDLNPEQVPKNPQQHLREIMSLVGPDRREFGKEALGLALAQDLNVRTKKLNDPVGRFWITAGTLWAYLANGLDCTELRSQLTTLDVKTPERFRQQQAQELYRIDAELKRRTVDGRKHIVAELSQSVATMTEKIAESGGWYFDNLEVAWWHEELSNFITDLEFFLGKDGDIEADSKELGWSIRRRRAYLDKLKRLHEESAEDWQGAIDRMNENPLYSGVKFEAQVYLVPLGPDPKSRLEEFWFPASGARPLRNAVDGPLVIDESSGIVFVLLPGARYFKGAQNSNPGAPGYDPRAQSEEGPVRLTEVAPFLISKFEMTQGQFMRLSAHNPSTQQPGFRFLGSEADVDLRHPVESTSWRDSRDLLARFGLELPSQAVWEYAARGGTKTPWHVGDDARQLDKAANLADLAAKRLKLQWPGLAQAGKYDLDDGRALHAPVGSFQPNQFGLHDTIGNVAEWCRNKVRIASGPKLSDYRPALGGHFMCSPYSARVTHRFLSLETTSFDTIGIRPVRRLP